MTCRIADELVNNIWTPPEAKLVMVKAADVERLPHLAHLWRPGVVMQGHQIQWCCETWNAWIGCTRTGQKICERCYAEWMDFRFQYGGYTHWGPGIMRHPISEARWPDLYLWDERIKETGEIYPNEGKTVFPNSMGDWMDTDPGVPEEWRQRLLRAMRETPHVRYPTLTKRPQNFKDRLPRSFAYTHSNVMLGISVDSQEHLDRDLPFLLGIEAAGYLLSIEGRSEPIDLTAALKGVGGRRVSWVQDGGCSDQYNYAEGRMMRGYPFDVALARDTIRQCREFDGVFPFIKQLGSNVFDNGKPVGLKDKHGGDMNEWAELGYQDIMVRELPPMLTD
jgi:protein gp37